MEMAYPIIVHRKRLQAKSHTINGNQTQGYVAVKAIPEKNTGMEKLHLPGT